MWDKMGLDKGTEHVEGHVVKLFRRHGHRNEGGKKHRGVSRKGGRGKEESTEEEEGKRNRSRRQEMETEELQYLGLRKKAARGERNWWQRIKREIW